MLNWSVLNMGFKTQTIIKYISCNMASNIKVCLNIYTYTIALVFGGFCP